MCYNVLSLQAARLTSYCRRLRRLGLEIGARPFSYQDTPQLVLDSFLQYTTSTKYTVRGHLSLSLSLLPIPLISPSALTPYLPLSPPPPGQAGECSHLCRLLDWFPLCVWYPSNLVHRYFQPLHFRSVVLVLCMCVCVPAVHTVYLYIGILTILIIEIHIHQTQA